MKHRLPKEQQKKKVGKQSQFKCLIKFRVGGCGRWGEGAGGDFSKNRAFVSEHLERPDVRLCVYGCLNTSHFFCKGEWIWSS